jgi:hypothetical protein
MIVLLGTYDNVTAIITRRHQSSGSANAIVNVDEPTSCYHKVYAFDIEHDGGIGVLAVPGQASTVGESSMEPLKCEISE